MKQQVSFHNDKRHDVHKVIGGVMRLINPGETIMVDAPASVQMVEVASEKPGLPELLKGTVKEIEPLLADMDEATLTQLLALEKAMPTPRASLIKEIEATLLALKTAA